MILNLSASNRVAGEISAQHFETGGEQLQQVCLYPFYLHPSLCFAHSSLCLRSCHNGSVWYHLAMLKGNLSEACHQRGETPATSATFKERLDVKYQTVTLFARVYGKGFVYKMNSRPFNMYHCNAIIVFFKQCCIFIVLVGREAC